MIKWLDKSFEETIMIILLCGMVIIMGIQVCSRYLLGFSLSWSEELTRYLFVWFAFFSLSFCIKRGTTIKIDQFVKLFTGRDLTFIHFVNYLIEIGLLIYLLPFSFSYLTSSIAKGQVSPALGLPMYFIHSAPFICMSLALFRLVQHLYRYIKTLKKGGAL